MLNKPMFHMGASFDEDRSDDESNYQSNGNLQNNNNCRSVKDENIPLVSRK